MSFANFPIGLAAPVADPADIVALVGFVERHGLAFAVFDDDPGAPGTVTRGGLDPVEAASFAAALTRSIGLVATAPVTHAEPFHLSNRFSSLDRGSSGRAGWLATIDASPARARAYSATPPEPATAGHEAAAVVDAVRRLWDSWEDGALIADMVGGRFLDQAKLHHVDVRNEFFSIRGPALMPRPVQGQVVVLARDGDQAVDPDVVLVRGADRTELLAAAARVQAAGDRRVVAELGTGSDPGALLALLRSLVGRLDGAVLRPEPTGAGREELARVVLPALLADGTLAPSGPRPTLRDRFRLPRPASRYATTSSIPTVEGRHQ